MPWFKSEYSQTSYTYIHQWEYIYKQSLVCILSVLLDTSSCILILVNHSVSAVIQFSASIHNWMNERVL